MKRKWIAMILLIALTLTLCACSEEEEETTTTLTGMIVSLDGTTLSVIETNGTVSGRGEGERTMPTNADGSVNFEGFGGFNGEGFDPNMMGGFDPSNIEGFDPSNIEGFDPSNIEGFDPGTMGGFNPGNMGGFDPGSMEGFDPESFGGTFPQGGERPQWSGEGEMPEGFTPGDGGFSFGGERGSFDPAAFGIEGETKTVDISNAHISVDNDGTKETGTTDNLTPGATVTITLNSKGEATYILVTPRSNRFGGRGQSQGE